MVDTPFVRCLEEVDYEKALGQLVVLTRKFAMSEIPSATEVIQFWQPFKSFYRLLRLDLQRT